MQAKIFKLDVGCSDEMTESPGAAVVEISAALAARIRGMQALVLANDLYSTTTFNETPTWLRHEDSKKPYGEKIECSELVVTSTDCLWQGLLGSSNIVVTTDETPIADLPASDSHGEPDNPFEAQLQAFLRQQIDDGNLDLDELPSRLVRYGLMQPSDFVDEMRERMALPDAES